MSNTSKKKGEPMRRMRKGLSALVLAICLLMSIALGGKALAAGEGANTLSTIATASTDEAFKADIAKANVQVDVYQVATAAKDTKADTYNYTLVAPFNGLQADMEAALDKDNAGTWEAFADKAAGLIGTATKAAENVPVGTDIKLDDGLYLVIAHGAGITDKPVAYSEQYAYTFAPSLVSLPTKVQATYGDDGYLIGPIATDASFGEWLTSVTIALKPEQTPLFGSLQIDKIIPVLVDSKPCTFVFHVVDTATGGKVYDNYGSVYVTAGGTDPTSTTITHIPAGIEVTVTESYDGARYKQTSPDPAPVKIIADEVADGNPAKVSFTNEPDGNHTHGYGIENYFEYVNDEIKWDLVRQTGLVTTTQE